MKKRKIVMSVLIVTMLASCMACGKIHDHKGDTLKNSVTEKVTISDTEVAEDVEPIDVKVDDLKALADAGVITGVKDITVAEGTDVNLNDLVYADKNIVKSVDIDDSKVDYSKAGTYEVINAITFDGDKFRDYVKDNNIDVNFDTDSDTIVVKTTVTVTVATKEEADKAISSGNTDVVTPETKESVAESNKAKANDNAVASKPAEKPAKKPAGNNNGNSSNAGNNGNGNSGGNNGNHNGNTEKPHIHKYNGGVVTAKPDCTHTGIKTYTCVDGDYSYDETIPMTPHEPETRTETVTVKEAWTEDVWESRYICNGCGEQFTNTTDVCRHILAVPNDACGSYYSDSVKVNTIQHPAQTETRTYTVCKHCGNPM